MNVKKIRKDFPILNRRIKGKQLIYFDNAATTQKPIQVIDAISDYYKNHNANIHRGIHTLSLEATQSYEEAHVKAAKFINASFEEAVFTRGTTESINLLAHSFKQRLKKGDEILLSDMEHHSNLVPWQEVAREKGAKLKFIDVSKKGTLDEENIQNLINKKTKIVSLTHMSNVLGTINDIKKIGKLTHENNSLFIVDGAQSAPHTPINVKKLNCDFFAFSGHKMLGPTGIGVLYGKKNLLEDLPPFLTGGDMIKDVSRKTARWNNLPWKFEAGTPNIAGAVGFAKALDYLHKLGMNNVEAHSINLARKASKLLDLKILEHHGPSNKKGPVFSFNIKGVHAHDAAALLDKRGIAVRTGHHCAMPLMEKLGLNGSLRASFYIYNTIDEIKILAEELEKVKKIF